MPKSPKNPSKRDRGVGDQELEDRVGRRPDEKPDMVPPGTTVGRPDEDSDDTRIEPEDPETDRGPSPAIVSRSELDDEAIEADRATARRSDRMDGRDGVDASDFLPLDPDSLGGRRRS